MRNNEAARKHLWLDAVEESKLSKGCKHLLLCLGRKMNANGGSCYPNIKTIMRLMSSSNASVQRYIAEAVYEKWLTKDKVYRERKCSDRRRFHHNTYTARWPDDRRDEDPNSNKDVDPVEYETVSNNACDGKQETTNSNRRKKTNASSHQQIEPEIMGSEDDHFMEEEIIIPQVTSPAIDGPLPTEGPDSHGPAINDIPFDEKAMEDCSERLETGGSDCTESSAIDNRAVAVCNSNSQIDAPNKGLNMRAGLKNEPQDCANKGLNLRYGPETRVSNLTNKGLKNDGDRVSDLNTNLSENISNNPSNGRARENLARTPGERGGCNSKKRKEKEDQIEIQFKKLILNWPDNEGRPKKVAYQEWKKLTDEERSIALKNRDGWISQLRCQGRKIIYPPSDYLGDKLFLEVKEVPRKEPNIITHLKPYGIGWMELRLQLLQECIRQNWIPTDADRRMIDSGKGHLIVDKRHRAEFPEVWHLDLDAENERLSPRPRDFTLPKPDTYKEVEVGSPEWNAWQDWHKVNDYPPVPDPRGKVKTVWFPKKHPKGFSID